MTFTPQDSNEPKIIGFESKPVTSTQTTDFKTMGQAIGAVLIAVFVFCFVTGTSFDNKVTSPHKNQKKYVSKSKGKSYRSANEAIRAVNQSVEDSMRQSREMLDSIGVRK